MQDEITSLGSLWFLIFWISGVDLEEPILKRALNKPFLLLKCLKIKPSETPASFAIDLVEVPLKPLFEKSSSYFCKIRSFFFILVSNHLLI